MKQSTKLIIGVMAGLFILAAILVVYNLQNVEDEKELLTLYVDGEKTTSFTSEEVLLLDAITDVTLTQNKNAGASVDRNLTVISIKDLLAQAGIDVNAVASVSATALDGFATTYTQEEIASDDQVYIILQEDGTTLSDENGNFAIAVPGDSDSTRWNRQIYILDITLS